jgi:isoquinoline 1-oxidoreductase subunit beta
MKRRTFILRGVAAAGAIGIGWSLLPPRSRLGDAEDLPERTGHTPLNGWVRIGADDTVTVIMSKSEMGQGVHTALAMLLAEELDADWAQVRTEMSSVESIYNNVSTVVDALPFHPDDHGLVQRTTAWLTAKTVREVGVMMTGGSSSIKDLWLPMRQAGASARAMLVAAAAEQWKVPVSEITVANGVVRHASGKDASFGSLIAAAKRQQVHGDAPLKTADTFRLIGTPVHRIEGAAKSAGSATFGIDVTLPGMLYATVVMCPTLGGTVTTFDATAALALPGVKQAFPVAGYNGGTAGIAVIADTPFHTLRAVKAVSVDWNHGAMATVSSDQIMRTLSTTLDTEDGHAYFSHGDVDAALSASASKVVAEYRAPFLAHATMEPMNCTVQFNAGRATVWAPTQVPDLARRAAAKALGISQNEVAVKVQLIGGGFGRRLDVDFIGQAAAIAKMAPGVPVQTFWSREQDVRHDFYRPACVARFTAGLSAKKQLVAWRNTSAGPAIVPQALRRYFDLPAGPIDKTASEGAFDQAYEYPTARIAHEIVAELVPIGFWRSVGHSHQAFFTEGFMDEVAHAAGTDPLAFRLGLLKRHPRHARVLQRVAETAGWNTPLVSPDGVSRVGRGVALHQSFGSVVAHVAEVSVDPQQNIRVTRVVSVIDCGFPVNPHMIRQQIEGSVIFGLSAALFGEITIENGQVKQQNFNDYRALRINECPVIDVDIIPSAEHPEGVGEPGVPPLAPAVANAIFAATGERLRSLPLRLTSAGRTA